MIEYVRWSTLDMTYLNTANKRKAGWWRLYPVVENDLATTVGKTKWKLGFSVTSRTMKCHKATERTQILGCFANTISSSEKTKMKRLTFHGFCTRIWHMHEYATTFPLGSQMNLCHVFLADFEPRRSLTLDNPFEYKCMYCIRFLAYHDTDFICSVHSEAYIVNTRVHGGGGGVSPHSFKKAF